MLAARVGDIVMPDIVEVAVEQTSCVEEPALLISKGGVAGDSRGGGHRAGIGDVGAVMAARERDLWIRGFAYGERVSGRDDGDFGMEVRDAWGKQPIGRVEMNRLMLGVLHGAAAGAAGTTALNAVTYLDMVIRARPESTTPGQMVDALARTAGVELPGSEQEREHRRSGLGSLAGILTGVGAGAVVGLVRATGRLRGTLGSGITATLLALAGSNGPMTALGVTDPRKWTAADWISDLIPHIAYGTVTALVLDHLSDRQASLTSTTVVVKRLAHAILRS